MTTNLVLGSEGFVGKDLCNFLRNCGETVVPFDNVRNQSEDGRWAVLPLGKVDRVYFLAWEVGGSKYLQRQDIKHLQLDTNLRLMSNVFPQLREAKLPFLFVSSQLAEEVDSVYGVTKRLGEVWTHLIQGARVRLWNIYGAYESPSERSHLVADFIWQALTTGEIRMITTGAEQRQFIHVDDACRGFHAAMELQSSEVFDVTTGVWSSVREVASLIASLTDARVIPGTQTGLSPQTPVRGKVPGWSATVNLEAGLQRAVQMFRDRMGASRKLESASQALIGG